MKNDSNKRIHERYKIPVSMGLPKILDEPVEVEDISEGGFRVVVSKKPEEGAGFEGTLHLCMANY